MTTELDPQRPFDDGSTAAPDTRVSSVPVPDPALEPGITTITVDERKVTWGYVRKIRPAEYESEEASMYITEMAPPGVVNVLAWAQSVTQPAFDVIKPQVWEALRLGFSFDASGHPSEDNPVAQVPTAPPPAAAPPPPPPPQPQQQAPAPAPAPSTAPPANGQRGDQPSMAQPGYYAEFPGFCKECGEREFYDNRGEGDQKILEGKRIGPDFKCKACKWGVFRPGSYPYNEALKKGRTNQPPPPPVPVAPGPPPNPREAPLQEPPY